MTDPDKVLGKSGEDRAVSFLRQKGYFILARNFRTRLGEIDIIAKEKDTIVFVEVKTRRSLRYGRPCEAVSRHKQFKMRITAQSYLAQKRLWESPCRFDIIEILDASGGTEKLQHLRGAFWLDT